MRTNKQQRERFAEMRGIIERICDADLATRGSTDTLRERMAITTVIDAQDAIVVLTAVQTAVSVAIAMLLMVSL